MIIKFMIYSTLIVGKLRECDKKFPSAAPPPGSFYKSRINSVIEGMCYTRHCGNLTKIWSKELSLERAKNAAFNITSCVTVTYLLPEIFSVKVTTFLVLRWPGWSSSETLAPRLYNQCGIATDALYPTL